MEVVYGTHEAFYRHDTGSHHPERPARLQAVELGVEQAGLPVRTLVPTPASLEMLSLVHSPSYIEAIERFCRAGGGHLDLDTVVSFDSWEAALLAAGAGAGAVEALRAGGDRTAFLAVRPPGHHAGFDQGMGFCLFNNVAVTAAWLREQGNRVAILDWDVHHGNGSQAIFNADPEVLYVSLHQFPFYPYQGDVDEIGEGPGEGTAVNIPFPAGTAGDAYRYAWLRVVGPVLAQYQPDWLLVSSGYDAHHEDPLAELRLEAADFGWMAAKLPQLIASSRTIFFLEGGYHLPALTSSVAATLQGIGGSKPPTTSTFASPTMAYSMVDHVADVVGRYWSL